VTSNNDTGDNLSPVTTPTPTIIYRQTQQNLMTPKVTVAWGAKYLQKWHKVSLYLVSKFFFTSILLILIRFNSLISEKGKKENY
jgi:hypothetical protein